MDVQQHGSEGLRGRVVKFLLRFTPARFLESMLQHDAIRGKA
jgi:hypothetical protein